MNTTSTDPIHINWSSCGLQGGAAAAEVVGLLGQFAVNQIPAHITPYLAAASAEIASIAEIRWRFSPDDATVALLRMMSRGTLAKPDATGPHIQRLFDQLVELT